MGRMFDLPSLVFGNFKEIVLSSMKSFGFYTFIVGRTPYPLRSNINLCVFGFCSPF
jgi:hypothetical protein